MGIKGMIFDDMLRATAFISLYFALFLVAKWFKGLFTSYNINNALTKEDNLAIALTMSGYYFATAIIFVGTLFGPTHGFQMDFLTVAVYSLLGLILLNVSRFFNDKMILRKFCDTTQLIKEQNIGVGAVQFGAYVATGIIAAGAVSGQGNGILNTIVFFVLGQIILLLFSLIYEKLSPYDIHEELRNKNIASGVAFGGNLIALSLIVMNAAAGDLADWRKSLMLFGITSVAAFVFLPIIRIAMDKLVVPGSSISHEIRDDKNIGAGILEATIAISFAVIVTRLI